MRRTVLAAGMAVAVSVGLAACGGDDSSGSGGGGGGAAAKPLVGVDYPRSDTDFWNSYIKYTPQFADSVGVQLKTTNSQNDVATLASNVQTLVSQNVKGVVMAPQDTAAIVPTLQTCSSARSRSSPWTRGRTAARST